MASDPICSAAAAPASAAARAAACAASGRVAPALAWQRARRGALARRGAARVGATHLDEAATAIAEPRVSLARANECRRRRYASFHLGSGSALNRALRNKERFFLTAVVGRLCVT